MLARAQSTYQYRYWFDDDEGRAVTTESGSRLKVDIELDGLQETLHSLHVQVTDEKGVVSSPHTLFFVKSHVPTSGPLKYWFDDNTALIGTLGEGSTLIDVSHLADGIHNLHVQKSGSSPSAVVSAMFLKVSAKKDFVDGFRYWFDQSKATEKTLKGMTVLTDVDVSGLEDGLHMLHVQATGNSPSAVHSSFFLKTPQVKGVESLKVVTSIDGKVCKQEDVAPNGGLLHYDFDATGLSEGVHLLSAQVITPSGVASAVKSSYFLRVNTAEERARMKCFYAIDGEKGFTQAGTFANGTFHFDLDVAALSNGLHRLTYLMITEGGTASAMRTAFFMKTPLGGNGISAYHYWLNTDYEGRKQVNLEKNVNPLNLMSLLPVESVPLRSSQFHFEWKDGKPMIYAQNDFHIRFYDAADRCVDQSKDFTDYAVSQEVTDAELLVSGSPVVKDKPGENEIQWYHFPAAVGDSLSFKVDRACTVQVFAPSAKEVYNASGSDVVRWDGCHAWEDGEYYLALHDVTAQQGTNTTLEYQHIDKYDILAYDVHEVGNGGFSDIFFDGNGFYSLKSIELVNAQNDTIRSEFIDYISDAKIRACFNFSGVAIGKYKAIFHFIDEDRTISNALTVEEATELALTKKVSFATQFLRGTANTYTLTISNKGNSTAYHVPIFAYIKSALDANISQIKIEGIDLPKLSDFIADSLSSERLAVIQQIQSQIEDKHFFVGYKTFDDEKKDSVAMRSALFYTNIQPRSTVTITFRIKSDRQFEAKFGVPDEIEALQYVDILTLSPQKIKGRGIVSSACCLMDATDCMINVVVTGLDYLSLIPFAPIGIADCLAGLGKLKYETSIPYQLCQYKDSKSIDDVINTAKKQFKNIALSGLGSLLSCLAASDLTGVIWGDILSAAVVGLDQITINETIKCSVNLKDNLKSCIPSPYPGGPSTPVNSLDPNDITGYTAESGSRFVKKDLVDVFYKIEFENDTAFATASAHTVVIKDTLDSRLFDLASFAPTNVKIGEKVVELDGTPDFVKTIDMRPEIYAIAQVEGSLDKQKGIATWTFTSLDPMTMEPTDDVMSGFLPVNYDGRGQGEVTFDIKLRSGLADGTEIPNRASIVFDNEEAIMTPTWVNTIDAVAPTSKILDVSLVNDSTAVVDVEGFDERSGIWRYNLYAQQGEGSAWVLAAENVDSAAISVKVYDGISYGFCVLATDSAGNVEKKELHREYTFGSYLLGDANSDGVVDLQDAMLIVYYFVEAPDTYLNFNAADINQDAVVDLQDAMAIVNKYVSLNTARIGTRKRINKIISEQ